MEMLRSTEPPAAALPNVVITGRPNVGKSTLFNRIVGERRAVVEATPGVTRDRLCAPAEWNGRCFAVTDTGGLGGGDGDPFAPLVAAQAGAALASADVVVLVVDARAGLVPADQDLAARLRRMGKPVVLIANKADRTFGAEAYEFYGLGLGEPLAVSASRGEGLGDALDRVVELLGPAAPPATEAAAAEEDGPIPVAFVGRPNVGKSSLVNRLLGQERLIVSELAGTTRDAIDVPWEAGGRRFVLVDTPGLRRPARIDPRSLEHWVAQRAASAIQRAEVVALLIDCAEPATDQDKRIAGRIKDEGRAAVILAHKADLLRGEAPAALALRVRAAFPFLGFAPVLPCSAHSGLGMDGLPAALAAAADSYRRRLPTPALNQCIRAAVAAHPPAAFEGKPVRIYYAAQIRTRPPTFALVTNRRGAVGADYLRHLENRLRERFGLEASPVRWAFRLRSHRRLHLGARTGDGPRAYPPRTRT